MSGDGNHSSAGPKIILLLVVILPVAYTSIPVPQLRIILPPVDATSTTDISTDPGKFSIKQSFNLKTFEPFKNYTPSIGISEISYASNYSEDADSRLYFVSSLRAGSIYSIQTNINVTKIINEDRIFFPQQRIRDMKYDEKNNIFFLLFDPIPSLGILEFKK